MNALIRAFSRMSAAIDERETALRTQAEERQALIDALAHEMRTPLMLPRRCSAMTFGRDVEEP